MHCETLSSALDLDPGGAHSIPLPDPQCSSISRDISDISDDLRSRFTVLGNKAASVHQITVVFENCVMLFILRNFCIKSGYKLHRDLLFPSVMSPACFHAVDTLLGNEFA